MTDTAERLYERVLVIRCQAGDEMAFAELIDLYHPRVRYFLRKLLGDADGAEDALQDVWLDVFRAVSRLADVGAFRAWLYRIARDKAFRALQKRRAPSQRLEDVELPDDGTQKAHFTAEDAEQVHAAIDQLAPEHREVVVLRYIEGMTYEEIARVVGCQVGTVRSRLHYSKRALRTGLERMNIHD